MFKMMVAVAGLISTLLLMGCHGDGYSTRSFETVEVRNGLPGIPFVVSGATGADNV
jgi:hypothetical protein